MKALRRALFAVASAAFMSFVLKLRGAGETPQQSGGWRELRGPDFK